MPNEVNDPSTTYVEDAADNGDIDLEQEEVSEGAVSIDDVAVDEGIPLNEQETLAYKLIKRAATFKGVAIQRDEYLCTELSKKFPTEIVGEVVNSSPLEADIPIEIIDELANAAIALETNKATALSALAGIPGGLAVVGTIPANLVQYLGHMLRIEQKLAYLYGWQSFLNEDNKVDDETMRRLILFLGVMMGVRSIDQSVITFANDTAKAGVAKATEEETLTDAFWSTPLKEVLQVVEDRLTKGSFSEFVTKGVLVLGGVVSGGITYFTFKPNAVRLKRCLRILPQATGVERPEEEIAAEFEQIDKETNANIKRASEAAKKALDAAADAAGGIANAAKDVAGNIANAAGDMAGNIANAAAGIGESSKDFFSRFAPKKKDESSEAAPDPTPEPVDVETIDKQLRLYKGLLDDGIITQEDFDAKKRELLGL